MFSSNGLRINKERKTVDMSIPFVLQNFSQSMMGRDTVFRTKNGSNKGIGMGFDANGQIALQYYKDYIPEGKSGFVVRFTTTWNFGVSTPIVYNYANLLQYSDVEDCIWFFCINPPPFNMTESNIIYWNGINKNDIAPLGQFMPFRTGGLPQTAGVFIFVVKDALYSSASSYGFQNL